MNLIAEPCYIDLIVQGYIAEFSV